MKLVIRGQQQEISATYDAKELSLETIKAKAEAFISALNIDNFFHEITKDIIDDEDIQLDYKAEPNVYSQYFRDLELQRLEFGDNEVKLFVDVRGERLTCYCSYESVGEIENLELDL